MELEKIISVIAEQTGVDRERIKPESTFKDIGADSLDIFEIISTLEEEFGLEFSNEDAEGITTVGGAAEFVKKALAQ
jgi:acyl carrier protein